MEIEHRENNIFYNVIRNGTSLTEVFCNLMQYKAFRDLFLNFVKNKTKNLNLNFDDIKYSNFETEKDFTFLEDDIDKKVGRGDLILNINELDYIFELKIENTTNTTKNQPNGYLNYLKKQDDSNYKKRLFFILPKGYLHKKDLEKVKENIVYWEDFLDTIKKAELTEINIFIKDFCDRLDDRWFHYEDIKFTIQELKLIFNKNKTQGLELLENINMPIAMQKIFKIVDEVKFEHYQTSRYMSRSSEHYGYILKNESYDIPEKWEFWFGVDFEIWIEKNIPITIQISSNEEEMLKIKKQLSLEEYTYKDTDETILYFPLDNKIFKSENIAKDIERNIEKLLEKIK